MRFDINETLVRHIATGGGAAFALRDSASVQLSDQIADLFSARSDIRRLDRSQVVARTVLQLNDFTDIMELRDIVAQQELRRLIDYSKQKDHTAHTVYLYLLGIWFFDNVTSVRSAFAEQYGETDEAEICDGFLYQWSFASLLHDIGYAFYDLSLDTKEDRIRIDKIYTWEWLQAAFGPLARGGPALSETTLGALRAAYERCNSRYLKSMLPPTSKYSAGSCLEVLDRLASAPWLGELHPEWQGKDIFDVLSLGPDCDLRSYASRVAEHGYTPDGTSGCVDHAVASGLLLFQYTSYCFWLMNELRSDSDAFDEATAGYDYDASILTKLTVDACRATAYHNVQPSVEGAQQILGHISLEKLPLLCLSIVCDELQCWDRYPAGDAILRQFRETAAASLEGADIELSCSGTSNRTALFRIGHPRQSDIASSLKRSLESKLRDHERIVQICE